MAKVRAAALAAARSIAQTSPPIFSQVSARGSTESEDLARKSSSGGAASSWNYGGCVGVVLIAEANRTSHADFADLGSDRASHAIALNPYVHAATRNVCD